MLRRYSLENALNPLGFKFAESFEFLCPAFVKQG